MFVHSEIIIWLCCVTVCRFIVKLEWLLGNVLLGTGYCSLLWTISESAFTYGNSSGNKVAERSCLILLPMSHFPEFSSNQIKNT